MTYGRIIVYDILTAKAVGNETNNAKDGISKRGVVSLSIRLF
jgi:hypothetical protein